MEPFKNAISPELVATTARHLARVMPGFDEAGFIDAVVPRLDALELKQRVDLVTEVLHEALPADAKRRYDILAAVLHPDMENSAGQTSSGEGLCGWGIWPLNELVAKHGLEDFDASLAILREMTMRGTSEFGVRPYIAADQGRALAIIGGWAGDPNHHVRRLVSEGTRPRLPWGMRLHGLVADPSPMLQVLEGLRDDPSEYVRRSVANHLNDIAKDHPDLTADIATAWLKDASAERAKLVRHACRTLIKQGHPATLAAFGLRPPEIRAPDIRIAEPTVEFGGALAFDVRLASTGRAEQKLAIDYVIRFRKANGALAPKVFKWTTVTLAPGEERNLSRRHPIKPITTRKYYGGEQRLSLRINGRDYGDEAFELAM